MAPPIERDTARPGRGELLMLAALIATAALLRFVGVGHHLHRGEAFVDERNTFIAPVLRMWTSRSLDPIVYAGYPGFFNYLVAVPVRIGQIFWPPEEGAALAARGFVAACGTLNVFLAYRLLRSQVGGPAALLCAALMAFSRGEVREAHYVSPDVLIVTSFLGVGLLMRGEALSRRRSVLVGVLVGVAIAIKYSALLLIPGVLAGLWVRGQLRARLAPFLTAAALCFAAAAPYALLHRSEQGFGLGESVKYYYGVEPLKESVRAPFEHVLSLLDGMQVELGVAGCLLLATALLSRQRRSLALPIATLVTSLAALSPTRTLFPRHSLVISAAAAWLAAAGFASVDAWLASRRPRLRPALLLGLAGMTLGPLIPRAYSVTAAYARPAEIDRAAAWVERRQPRMVLTSLNRFALDAPVEVRTRFQPGALASEVLRHYDLLVVHPDVLPDLPGFAELARFEDPGFAWGALCVMRPDPPLRLVRVAPDRVSGSAAGIERAFDGDQDTAWAAPAGRSWCEASWSEPQLIARIDFTVGGAEASWPQTVALEGREPGGPWRPLPTEVLRPVRRARQSWPHGQAFVLTPAANLEAVRLTRPSGGAWLLAELTVAKMASDP